MTSLPKHHWMSDRFMDHEVAKFRAKFLSCTLLAVAAVISATVLLAWIFKPFGNLLPESWDLMKFNTALCVLLSCYALYIQSESTRKEHLTGLLLLGGTILALSGSSLVGHVLDETFIIETIIVDDADASQPGRMSLATSIFFLLTSYSILWFGVSERTSVSYLKSPVTYLSIVVLLTGSSYFFSATGIYAQDTQTITSVHTFVCMLALVVSLIVVDVRDGHHIALLGRGTGTRILLISFPFLFLIPFGSIALGEYLVFRGLFSIETVLAMESTLATVALTLLVIYFVNRVNSAETDLRELALVDELTGLNNRRAFYTIGGYLFEESRRSKSSLTVLFFDLDGLKFINDAYGHEVGSELLARFSSLLQETFRQSDVIARIGGDEFVVLSRVNGLEDGERRLKKAVSDSNNELGREYTIRYSFGIVVADPLTYKSFSDVVSKADMMMYEQKRRKCCSNHGFEGVSREKINDSRAVLEWDLS